MNEEESVWFVPRLERRIIWTVFLAIATALFGGVALVGAGDDLVLALIVGALALIDVDRRELFAMIRRFDPSVFGG